VGAREGEGELVLVCGRPGLELAAAAIHGAGGGSAVAWREVRRAVTLLWATRVSVSDHKTDGDVPGSVRRPREERTAVGGTEPTGGPLGARRPAGARRVEGARLRGGLGTARGFGERDLRLYSQSRSAGRQRGRQVGMHARGRGAGARGVARRRIPAAVCFTVPPFDRNFLPKFE
jgi:hypothetical protein